MNMTMHSDDGTNDESFKKEMAAKGLTTQLSPERMERLKVFPPSPEEQAILTKENEKIRANYLAGLAAEDAQRKQRAQQEEEEERQSFEAELMEKSWGEYPGTRESFEADWSSHLRAVTMEREMDRMAQQ